MAIVKKPTLQVIGAITFRPFEDRQFAEIVFCAVHSDNQVRVQNKSFLLILIYVLLMISVLVAGLRLSHDEPPEGLYPGRGKDQVLFDVC